MVEGINIAKRKRGRPKKNVDKEILLSKKSTKSTKTSLGNIRGDMSRSLGGGDCFGGRDFTRHTITINTGEDIIKSIMSFQQNYSREVVVLSASGEVTNVKIQSLDANCNILTFKDVYKLISLSSPKVVSEDGVRKEIGGWQIMIGGANEYVFRGSLVGEIIMAASPVEVKIGSYCLSNTNPSQERNDEMASSSTGVQHPDMRRSAHSENLGIKRLDIDLNQPPVDFES